jgi:uncharacterized SAM-binding protein YcdF (DUF218 family)
LSEDPLTEEPAPARRFPHRWLLWILIAPPAALLLFALYLAADVYLYSLRDEQRPAGAAIVLGAAVYGDRPSPVLRERINHALMLYEQGYVDTLIFTGGQGQANEPTEAEVGRRYALARGIPPSAILTEGASTNTRENLMYAREVAEENGIDSFLIVSTPYHMRRAMALAYDLGMEAYSSPTRSTRWISWRTQSRAYLREVGGYGFYLLGMLAPEMDQSG